MTSQGKAFYDRQVAYLEANDVDALVRNQYHPDAVIVSFEFTKVGLDAIREHFKGYLEQLGGLHVKSTDQFTETDDSIFFQATAETGLGEAKVYDVFMLRDGKATHHFTGVISVTPRPVAAGSR